MYLLAAPTHDGARRTRQAVESLRGSGYQVHADYSLDPSNTKAAHVQTRPVRDPREWYRTDTAQAAATASPQYATARARSSGPPQTTPVASAPAESTQPSRSR
ncbi:hypothetical protein ACGFYY_41235 [Streptomyces sp. NPDC048331]|uniref:hypothetical protein n=1 Tax=Streptomyces sp. NPDC048331 TaxID=3365534 RepID=UPI0037123579